MKLSDYVVGFLADLGIRHAFVIQGGAVAHIIDSMAANPEIDYVCVGHEQAGAIAVHGYAAKNGGFGCAAATTGPGIINLVNGMACLYYDSMPSIFLGGQVTTSRHRARELGIRQLGFQESPHCDLVAPVAKYAATVTDPATIRYHLEKAVYLAREGRPGPVFLDICDDVQRMDIDPTTLEGFIPPQDDAAAAKNDAVDSQITELLRLLARAERPVLALGGGVKVAGARERAIAFAEKLGIPVLNSWASMDFLSYDHPLNAGGFGVHSPRFGNFTVQNCDLLIAVGIRLSQHQTGTPIDSFARGARKIVVDVDPAELSKFPKLGLNIDLPILADAAQFFESLECRQHDYPIIDLSAWRARVAEWKALYPADGGAVQAPEAPLNPYVFMTALSAHAGDGDYVFGDVGATLSWMFQAFRTKGSQTLMTSFNNHTMGYALPAAIGAGLANPDQTIISLNGDGSVLMNIQELGTLANLKLSVKVIILNNHGYGVIQQTQEDYFESRYNGVTPASGLMDPDYSLIARGFGLKTIEIRRGADLEAGLSELFSDRSPAVCLVEIDPAARISPAVKNMRPIEDTAPFLPREELAGNMIVPLLP
jgi:acetolactate synthase-1/2/3 large subunit